MPSKPASAAVTIQLLEYPGSQKSALWGMKDMLNFAGALADDLGTRSFAAEISPTPHGRVDVAVLPPALSNTGPNLPQGWDGAPKALQEAGTMWCWAALARMNSTAASVIVLCWFPWA